jgi:hypothetical protein
MTGTTRTGNLTHAIAGVAGRQHGVISRAQLRSLGLSDSAVSARIDSGYLRPLFRSTFAVGHSAINRHAHMLAAALACGPGTIVSHGSACELIGLWDVRPAAVDVIPPNWSGREIEGIRWHRVRLPEGAEVEARKGVLHTSPSRTLVDMAGRCGSASLRRLVEQAAILGLLDVHEIDRILALGRRRGAPRLRAILSPWHGTAERRPKLRSRLEARLLPRLISEGLPSPHCNVKVQVDGH